MLRRLHHEQPDSFAFTPANLEWAKKQIAKYPEGRQASAIIPLLWRAQEQEGWLTRPAIEYVADMLGMPYIRALEVATFYFMFQLQPVGSVAHVQVCGTTSCMICGAEDLIAVCKEKIAPKPHQLSADGRFSWEEVECLGACANAPMVQIGKDFYEDLTAESFAAILDAFARGEVPRPGPQNGRFAAEPKGGPTTLIIPPEERQAANASVALALAKGDTIARITGEEEASPAAAAEGEAPELMSAPPAEGADDLKKIKGIGPKLEKMLNDLGVYLYRQIAAWTPAHAAWIDSRLEGFKGRVARDEWVAQARTLAEGGKTEFSERVERGEVPSSE
ncbi:NADH-quinone oxidoreductase subunit NuoE [Oceanicella actignis]|uniref:NADH-quinone oxidoreductase subunit NuoE n=1 Tax=Oceanicella actignis TaxID=1189325 RepID=UPI0011E6FDEE|nr:NADH-quinone oxidoreductase subunit NuoE [Oceanicella actignis]TYO90080.1 NADH-quinone oxidoreductase subunit E [Oceanicella actignis]